MDRLETATLPIFRKGHIPMIGERAAESLIRLAGSIKIGNAILKRYNILQHNVDSTNTMQYLE